MKDRVLAIPADGAKEEDVKNVIDNTIEEYGKIDIIINNGQASKSELIQKMILAGYAYSYHQMVNILL